MNDILVSIIIPVYNAEKYLKECICSAINQSWINKEIIIVDDCSTDDSYKIAKSFESDNISLYQLEVNMGQSAASNFGIIKAKGQFIKFLDADDVLDRDFISASLKNSNDRDIMYFSHCAHFKGDFNLDSVVPYPVYNWEFMKPIDFLLSPVSIMRQGGRWLIPKNIIDSAGLWDESLSLINDYEYFSRLCLGSRAVKYVPAAKLYYRHTANSLSSSNSKKAFRSAIDAINLTTNLLLRHENTDSVKLYSANIYQKYKYAMYPAYRDLCKEIDAKIKLLGGSNFELEVEGKSKIMRNLLGWKMTLIIKEYLKKIKATLS